MYSIGEKPGTGDYCHTSCGWKVHLDNRDDSLPPYGNFGAGPNTRYDRC